MHVLAQCHMLKQGFGKAPLIIGRYINFHVCVTVYGNFLKQLSYTISGKGLASSMISSTGLP